MTNVLVDSNIILDIITEDPNWFEWSSLHLIECESTGNLLINPIIYAEVSIGFVQLDELDSVIPPNFFQREPLPWEAAFLAGKAFQQYRQSRGDRRSPLPDFYIGAHAVIRQIPLLTRDAKRYRTYFPNLQLIAP
ncbi:PIN domain-containing protein [Cuspidothrix issatschenkoi LEGE 03284]|uniref:type II toxin-antitoxin system VapC family toxin n=1 Tax=Cuspidothrix issatschenkoi TaxID=230752 RepID=UPI001882AD38|nr:PIN domain-containing protein [Cuspidothrix issatschenkoi]MBE9231572.1 PIN domain-containing protein [Cuspidothrix issatschenkoi LEGE 03284]